jgi:hypothetical protein
MGSLPAPPEITGSWTYRWRTTLAEKGAELTVAIPPTWSWVGSVVNALFGESVEAVVKGTVLVSPLTGVTDGWEQAVRIGARKMSAPTPQNLAMVQV